MGSLQQGLLLLEGTWRPGSSATINQPPPPSSSTYPTGSLFPAAPSPAISEAALFQYSSCARSYLHSSFESKDTAGSTPHASFLLLKHRSKTTAATKAAAIRRRKVGVAARYICDMCGESFTRRYNLRGHQQAHKGEKPIACGYPGCNSRFACAHDQKRHYKLHLGVKDYSCLVCQKMFIRLDALQRHQYKSDARQACFQELQQQAGLASALASSAGHGGPLPRPPDMGAASSLLADAPSLDNPPPQDLFHHDSFAFLHSHQPLDLHPQQHQQQQHWVIIIHTVHAAIIVCQRKPWHRRNGIFLYFEDNTGVIVNPKGEMKGSAIASPVAKESLALYCIKRWNVIHVLITTPSRLLPELVHACPIQHYHHPKKSPKPLWTLAAHNASVPAFDVSPVIPGLLISGGLDKTDKVWNLEDKSGAPTLSMVLSQDLGVFKLHSQIDLENPKSLNRKGVLSSVDYPESDDNNS
ncbi:hypothetical protein PCASD_04198 [Puccinia coronata f. sp. avenae]|uniref:C2H2-type domain-containing protein n=1 Tax=Puccinia coronata f. sp. avenae TaxID=200324 RepID=A0A2N5V8F0_9BASI|nr:hypothetical protein PCASD_04198 [Puccinia coronata f. sp. avenae]